MELKIKYDAWLHWSLTNACNLNCRYCFGYNHHAGFIPQAVDIDAVTRTLDQTGLVFRIGFTGNGEPFLIPNFIELCDAVAKKHFITINTNLISSKVEQLTTVTGLAGRVIRIFAAVHFAELERLELWELFIKNYQKLISAGFTVELTAVAWPGYIQKIEPRLEYFRLLGTKINFEPFFGIFEQKKYPAAYSATELSYFGLTENSSAKFNQFATLCNAGFNAGIVTPTGKIFSCFQETEKLGSIYSGFKFNDELKICRHKICGCPLKVYDAELFERASNYMFPG